MMKKKKEKRKKGEEEEAADGKAKLGKGTSSYLQFCDSYAQNASKGIAQRSILA